MLKQKQTKVLTGKELDTLIQQSVLNALERGINALECKLKALGNIQQGYRPLKEWLSMKETAKELDVSLNTLNRYVRSGKIKSHKVQGKRRFKLSDINDFREKPNI